MMFYSACEYKWRLLEMLYYTLESQEHPARITGDQIGTECESRKFMFCDVSLHGGPTNKIVAWAVPPDPVEAHEIDNFIVQ